MRMFAGAGRPWLLAVGGILTMLIVAGCGGGSSPGTGSTLDGAEVVAVVNGTEITAGQLYEAMVRDYGADALDRLITESLISQEADQRGIQVSESELDDRMEVLIEDYGGEAGFQMLLLQSGMTEDMIREQIRFNIMLEKILEPDMDLSDEVLQTHFEENRSLYAEQDQVLSRHILLDTEEEALEVLAELEGGADFHTLAKERSIDPSAAVNEGDLGWQARNQLVPEFFDAAFEAEPDSLVGPVESDYGFHIIMTLDRREGREPDLDEVRDQVRQDVMELQLQEMAGPWLQELYAQAQIDNRLDTGR